MPRVVVHNPVLAYENGDEFMQAWYDAEAGKLDPFVLDPRGLASRTRRSTARATGPAMGVNPETGQPITTNEWIDRLAPKAAAVVAVGTCATYGGIPAMKNNPTGAMGLPDYLGWNWKSKAGLPIVCIPGCPAQPDNIDRDAAVPRASRSAGMAPLPELDDAAAARSGCSGAPCARAATAPASTEQGNFATEYGDDHRCLVKLGCKGPVVKCNVPVRGWQSTASAAARTSAASAWRARCRASPTSTCRSWTRTRAGEARRELRSKFTYGPILRCGPQAQHQDASTTRSRSGGTTGPELTTGYAKRW